MTVKRGAGHGHGQAGGAADRRGQRGQHRSSGHLW